MTHKFYLTQYTGHLANCGIAIFFISMHCIKYLYCSLAWKVFVSTISQQARTNVWSCGHWPGGIVGSNSAEGIDVCLL